MKNIWTLITGLGGWSFWLKIGAAGLAALSVLTAGIALRSNGRLAERAAAMRQRANLMRKQEKQRIDSDVQINRMPRNSSQRQRLRQQWTRSSDK